MLKVFFISKYFCEFFKYILKITENIFIINTEDLLFDDGSIEGLNFAVKLLNNLEAYDLVFKFD